MSKSSTCLKRKTTNEDSSDDPASKTSKLIEKMDVDQEVENESEDKENLKIAENGVPNEEDVEVMEVSSSNSEDEDDEEGEEVEEEEPDSEESNTSESENELPSCEPSGDNMAVVNSESKSDQNDSSKASNLRKKRVRYLQKCFKNMNACIKSCNPKSVCNFLYLLNVHRIYIFTKTYTCIRNSVWSCI